MINKVFVKNFLLCFIGLSAVYTRVRVFRRGRGVGGVAGLVFFFGSRFILTSAVPIAHNGVMGKQSVFISVEVYYRSECLWTNKNVTADQTDS